MNTPKYAVGDRVMLGEWEDCPRQPATILSADVLSWGISYVVEVDEPEDDEDDCLRELTEDQIEGPIAAVSPTVLSE